jgi:transposase
MPFRTKRQSLSLGPDEKRRLESLRRSRSEEKLKVVHAGILLDLANGMSDGAAARSNGVNRHTVALCARKFLQFGLETALSELPRPGKVRRIPDDAIAWVLDCACRKPKEVGYPHELWTYSLLQEYVRKSCVQAGHPSLSELSRSRLHRILTQGEIHPHRIRYYVERRDPEFEAKMAVVLHLYKEVDIINAELLEGILKEPAVVTISYDEKPGIQALATTTPMEVQNGRNQHWLAFKRTVI